jgi:octaprenyl-diphosphate synthase
MEKLKEIQAPVAGHIKAFEKKYKASMKSKVPLLNIVTRYILKRKGKQIRPLFVMLSADICGGVSESSYHAAALIELLHTASLVHDDVVDDSNFRRGFFSVNALWKNKIAVLVGDYLLARGLEIALDNEEFKLLAIVSAATKEMSEGELLQIEKARKLDITEDVYFEIIRKKTASLIAACCASGATSASEDQETINRMKRFGEYVGIAFQIKDDLLDYEIDQATGKPNGVDIKEKKITLPLIHMLLNISRNEKRKVINTIKNHNQDPARVGELIGKVNDSGGIEYARIKMKEYTDKALEILEGFPDSESCQSLKKLVLFTTEREK